METSYLIFYGFILIIGGVIGRVRAGSKISLIAGVLSGILVLLGIFLLTIDLMIGFGLIAAVSGLITISFIIRLAKTGKFMPAGMLCLLSLIATIVSVLQLIQP